MYLNVKTAVCVILCISYATRMLWVLTMISCSDMIFALFQEGLRPRLIQVRHLSDCEAPKHDPKGFLNNQMPNIGKQGSMLSIKTGSKSQG